MADPLAAFEAWQGKMGVHYSQFDNAKRAWLAACAWQREQDAKIAEDEPDDIDWTQGVNENTELLRKIIATAIREGR